MLNQARSIEPSSRPFGADPAGSPFNLPSYYEILEASPRLSAQSIILSATSTPPRTHQESSEVVVNSTPKQTSAAAKKKAHKKRKRTGRACVYCQKLHLSCDEQRPCSRCTKAGREDQCRDGKRKRRGRKRKNAPIEEDVFEEDDCCSDEACSLGHSPSSSHNHHHDEHDELSHSSADNDDTLSTVSNESSFVDKHSPSPKRGKPNSSPGFYDPVFDDEAVEAAALLLTFHNIHTNVRSQVRVL